MSFNVSNIELALGEKTGSSTASINLLEQKKIAEKINTGEVFSVSTYNDLPNPTDYDGQLFYVTDEEQVYWASSANGWVYPDNTINSLYGLGRNFCGALGTNTTADIPLLTFTQETTKSTIWTQVSVGLQAGNGLQQDGTLWSWGMGRCGQLAQNNVICYSSPVQEITEAKDWVCAIVGYCSASAIKSDGTLWGWGWNYAGQLALDPLNVKCCTPTQEISSATDWCSIASFRLYGRWAIKTNNTLWAFGQNFYGQLGNGDRVYHSSPVQEASSATNWCFIANSESRTAIAIKTDGTLWGWGFNQCGTIGTNNTIDYSSPVQEITSATDWCIASHGCAHTSAIKTNGTLWSWGSNTCGVMGINSTTSSYSSPVQEITSATDWCQVSSSSYMTMALKTNNTMWGFGGEICGELPVAPEDGNLFSRYSSPVQEYTSATDWCSVCNTCQQTMAIKNIAI